MGSETRNSWGLGRIGRSLSTDSIDPIDIHAPGMIPRPADAPPEPPAKPRAKPRTYRISTYITDDNGDLLEDMRRLIRKETGRNPKIAEVLELALQALEKEKMGG